MAKWIRNWQTPYTADGWGGHDLAFVMKEMLLVAGYSLDSDDGDAAWTSASNILVDEAGGGGVGTGFEVDAGSPRVIYDTQGRFTQAMVDDECSIALRGGLLDDDQNHSIWRIVDYIDANHVLVDGDGWNPFGWTTDTQLAGRIFKFEGLELTNGAWALMDGPGNERVRVRIEKDADANCYMQMAPFGRPVLVTGQGTPDAISGAAPTMTVTIAGLIGKLNKHMVGLNVTIAGAANANDDGTFPITAYDNATGAVTYTNAIGVGDANFVGTAIIDAISTLVPSSPINIAEHYINRLRFNAYIDSTTGTFISYWRNQDGDWGALIIGKLTGNDVDDTDPWVIWGGITNDPFSTSTLYGLDGQVTPAQLNYFWSYPQQDSSKNESSAFHNIFGRRVDVSQKTPVREPYIVAGDNAQGGFVRGRMPYVRLGYVGFMAMRPLDAAGVWLHWANGFFVPRNGPDDQIPTRPPAS